MAPATRMRKRGREEPADDGGCVAVAQPRHRGARQTACQKAPAAVCEYDGRVAQLFVDSLLLDLDAKALRGGRMPATNDLTQRAQRITAALLGDEVTVQQVVAAYRALLKSHIDATLAGRARNELLFSFVDLCAPGVHAAFFNPGHTIAAIVDAESSACQTYGPRAPELLFTLRAPAFGRTVLVMHEEQQGTARVPFVSDDFRTRFLATLLGQAQTCSLCGEPAPEAKSCYECGDYLCLPCHASNRQKGFLCRICNTSTKAPSPDGHYDAVITV